jgi:hypothetical protein
VLLEVRMRGGMENARPPEFGIGETPSGNTSSWGETGGVELVPAGEASRAGSPRLLVLLVALLMTLLVGGALLHLWYTGRKLLLEVELQGEGGLVQAAARPLTAGERLRLEVRLAQPAAVALFLQDPRGRLSEIDPQPGDTPVAAGPLLLLPPGDSYDTAGLDRGMHALWVVASTRSISPAGRAAIGSFLETTRRPRRRDVEPLRRKLGAEALEMVPRLFVLP